VSVATAVAVGAAAAAWSSNTTTRDSEAGAALCDNLRLCVAGA
jgi:hypothetical protein